MAYQITKEVFEIFEEFSTKTNDEERKQVLLKYKDVQALKDILRGTFDASLQFLLPEGRPPYTPNLPQSTPSSLLREHRTFGLFVKGGPGKDLPAYRREMKFIQLLESIHPDDALIVLSMVEKKSPVEHLTADIVKEVFPSLIKS